MCRGDALFAAIIALACSACTAISAEPTQPDWLKAKITQFEQLPAANPPRSILRTVYAGRTVYLVTAICCDIPAELYEESGQLICFPYGGFAGGDGRCPTFSLPPDGVTVWRDSRTARGRAKPASAGQ